jgi:predicted TIM-barrel fold metal-dependent hydrolase
LAFYRPVLNAMLSMFGPERLIHASNWPVSEWFTPLATVQGIVQDYCSHGLRAQEQVLSLSGRAAHPVGATSEIPAMRCLPDASGIFAPKPP